MNAAMVTTTAGTWWNENCWSPPYTSTHHHQRHCHGRHHWHHGRHFDHHRPCPCHCRYGYGGGCHCHSHCHLHRNTHQLAHNHRHHALTPRLCVTISTKQQMGFRTTYCGTFQVMANVRVQARVRIRLSNLQHPELASQKEDLMICSQVTAAVTRSNSHGRRTTLAEGRQTKMHEGWSWYSVQGGEVSQ